MERFWRSVKYEGVFLQEYRSVKEAREAIGAWIDDYNTNRLHQSLGYRTPDEVYFGTEQQENGKEISWGAQRGKARLGYACDGLSPAAPSSETFIPTTC